MEPLTRAMREWAMAADEWLRGAAGWAAGTVEAWREGAGEWLAPWLESPGALFADRYWLIAAAVVLLLAGNMAVLLATLVLRGYHSLRQRKSEARRREWHRLVPAFVAGEDNAAAIRASVGQGREREFAEYVRPFLIDIEGEDHQRLVELLESMGFAELLVGMLSQRSQWSRSFALHFLGLMGASEQVDHIRPHLADRSELVSHSAAEALMLLKDVASVPLILKGMAHSAERRQDRVSALISTYGAEIMPVLHRLLRESWLTGWMQVLILNAMADQVYLDAAWDILELATQTGEREVLIACLRALAEFEDDTLVGYFEDLLADADPVVRSVAARALGKIGEARHLEPLGGMLRSDNFWLLRETVGAMLALGPGGRRALADLERRGEVSPLARRLIHEALPGAAPGD